jgi:threonylcarbamoyladenosine tRNA methylthiotransferase MtaB
MTKTLKTVTLGCRVNQYETEFVRQGFEQLGYRDAADGEPVDLCIVNTCTVTAESEAKCRKIIRRLAKTHTDAKIIVLGCYAARAPAEAAALPGVVEVVPDKRLLPALLKRWGLADPPRGISHFRRRRRAYVKVQDGCRLNCTYCIVPTVRPHQSSRPAGEVLDEVRRLLAHGHREIVLTGIHLGGYGNDACRRMNDECAAGSPASSIHHSSFIIHHLCSASLAGLVRTITDLDGDFRVRLSSVEAAEVGPELIALMAERPERICPHLHLPLQSGSDTVLRRMNRRWPVRRFLERCQEIRAALDRPALTTDIIVGFPGETEADFAATCNAVREIGFAKVHVFRFSPRPDTPAARMSGQVQGRIAARRALELGSLEKTLEDRYLRSLLGRSLRVLVESPARDRPGFMAGRSDRYAPVVLPGGRELIGQFVAAVAEDVVDGAICGRRVEGATALVKRLTYPHFLVCYTLHGLK